MIRELHRWLIKLVVGSKPVIMNVHFLEGFVLAREHLEEGTLIVSCFFGNGTVSCWQPPMLSPSVGARRWHKG